MDRRSFLKLVVGTLAASAIPVVLPLPLSSRAATAELGREFLVVEMHETQSGRLLVTLIQKPDLPPIKYLFGRPQISFEMMDVIDRAFDDPRHHAQMEIDAIAFDGIQPGDLVSIAGLR